MDLHYRALEQLFYGAQINKTFESQMQIEHQRVTLTMEVKPDYLHGLGMMHGAICFKLLDDAAAFAAMSTTDKHPFVTVNFTIDYFAAVTGGTLTAVGWVSKVEGKKIFVESVLKNEAGEKVASGKGLFLPAKMTYAEAQNNGR